jgi:glycosyltransferase involved in cell wall biosynthesis
MRVLVAHNWYRSGLPSGENVAVAAEIADLRAAGIEVRALLPASDDIARLPPLRRIGVATGPVLNPSGVRELTRLISRFRPDVLHIHNVFPQISPWAVRTAQARGVPVVQTVHNFRHSCIAGVRYRAGAPCDACVGRRVPVPAVRHACYRGSRLQSTAMALGQVAHRGTWRSVDRFVVLNPLVQPDLHRLGIPADRIVLRATAAADPGPPLPPGKNVLYVGRLEEMKGAALLARAWALVRPPPQTRLRIIGAGPLEASLRRTAGTRSDMDVLGLLDAAGVARELRAAALVVVPSLCYEGQPLVYAEALAHGRPVLATDVGSLAGLDRLGVGWSVQAEPAAIAAALAVLHDGATLARVAGRARDRYEQVHTPQQGLATLLGVYRSVARSTLPPAGYEGPVGRRPG